MNNAMQSYKQTQVVTLGRADVTLLLYNGAIRFLEQAQEKMIEKDMQAKGNLISRTIDIINELDSSLNMAQGGELSQNLHKLYGFLKRNLTMANFRVDVAMAKSVQKNLEVLRDSFQQAMQTPEAKEMLRQMGPVKQASSGAVATSQISGSIEGRANAIKEMKDKAQALEKAQAQLASANTDEEKMLAREAVQKAREAIQKKRSPMFGQEDTSGAVSASLTSKASKAFATASNHVKGGVSKTVVQPVSNVAVSGQMNAASGQIIGGNVVSHQALNTQVRGGQMGANKAYVGQATIGQKPSMQGRHIPTNAVQTSKAQVNILPTNHLQAEQLASGESQTLQEGKTMQSSMSFVSPFGTGLGNIPLQKSAQTSALYAKANQQGLGKTATAVSTSIAPSVNTTPPLKPTTQGEAGVQHMPSAPLNVPSTPLVQNVQISSSLMGAGLADKKRNLYKNLTNA